MHLFRSQPRTWTTTKPIQQSFCRSPYRPRSTGKFRAISRTERGFQQEPANSANHTAITTAAGLFAALGMDGWRTHIPASERRVLKLSVLNPNEVRVLHRAIDKCLYEICRILLPNDADVLCRSFKEEGCNNSILSGAILDGIKASKKGSTERKTLHALLCASFPSTEARDLLRRNAMGVAAAESSMADNNLSDDIEARMAGTEADEVNARENANTPLILARVKHCCSLNIYF